MDSPLSDYKARPKLIELAPHQAMTIVAHRGTEIRVLEGELWITQEGDSQDYIVAAGTRYCSGRRGLVVASALRGASRAAVSWTDPERTGGYARSGVWLDYEQVHRLQNAARCRRAREITRLVSAAAGHLARVWHRLTRRRKAPAQLSAR